jgi:tRNA-dihydrouridine synthase B
MIVGLRELGRVFLAPLSGVADSPFRRICKRFGADTVYTEMVSCQGLTRGSEKTGQVFRFEEEERPIGVQLFGSDPDRMAASAALIEAAKPDFMDINLSCPARKIVTRGAGCALMRDLPKAEKVAKAVVRATTLPVTAKIRLGWDERSINAVRVAVALEDSGIAAIAVHGRTWEQGFKGEARWDEVAKVKRSVGVPIILSGDIFSPDAAMRAFGETGCDAVMVARGVYGRPWIFRSIKCRLSGEPDWQPTFAERKATILEHLDLVLRWYGEPFGAVRFRKHLLWYTKGVHGVVALRPSISRVGSLREIEAVLSRLMEGPEGDTEWTAK